MLLLAALVEAGDATGADAAGRFSITPPLLGARLLLSNTKASVAVKNIAAAIAVDFDKKLDEPLAPNKLPDEPDPKAAPMSAPLPCCSKTSPMIANADNT